MIDYKTPANTNHRAEARRGARRCPLFVELCAGTAALSLRFHAGRNARPPVSRMGAKTGYADVILRVLGLRPGQGHTDGTRYLWCEPDAGVRLLLHAYTDRDLATAAAEIIRSWKDEDPRALWERLRAEGPARCPEGLTARELARALAVDRLTIPQAKARGATDGDFMFPHPGKGLTVSGQIARLVALPWCAATIHPDARAIEPREVARWGVIGAWSYRAGNPDSGFNRSEAIGHPASCKYPRDCVRLSGDYDSPLSLPATIHPDAREIEPPTLPPGTVAYMDPPYLNTTGYAHDLGRDEVVRLARRWTDAGATVCISEAEPIPELLADGWHKVEITGERKGQRRTFSKQQAEWLTLNRAPAWVPSVQASLFGGMS